MDMDEHFSDVAFRRFRVRLCSVIDEAMPFGVPSRASESVANTYASAVWDEMKVHAEFHAPKEKAPDDAPR